MHQRFKTIWQITVKSDTVTMVANMDTTSTDKIEHYSSMDHKETTH